MVYKKKNIFIKINNFYIFILLFIFILLISIFLIKNININGNTPVINISTPAPVVKVNTQKEDLPPYKDNDQILLSKENGLLPQRTKGNPTEFKQIGVLTSESKDKILPLYGRQLYTSSNKWNYYTKNDAFHNVSLPVKMNNRDCDEETGCDELYSGDKLDIEELNGEFNVKIYKSAQYFYNPHLAS
jgi:hypothetical protein